MVTDSDEWSVQTPLMIISGFVGWFDSLKIKGDTHNHTHNIRRRLSNSAKHIEVVKVWSSFRDLVENVLSDTLENISLVG